MSVLQTSLQAPNVLIQPVRQHGGTDVLGPVRWDFSSNANACGPCPVTLHAVQQANPQRYPDPGYTHLHSALAGLHGVAPERVLLAASASECIQRITAWRWRAGDRHFWTPPHAYGDYTHAAQAWGLQTIQLTDFSTSANRSTFLADSVATLAGSKHHGQLRWLCDPGSPLGQSESAQTLATILSGLPDTTSNQSGLTLQASQVTLVVDRAYAPLRLQGQSALSAEQLEQVWQLWSPNKALGLTGVRAAYAIAPVGAEADVLALDALAASWPIGVHGEAMLQAWTLAETQQWVAQSRPRLAQWLRALRETLQNHGWTCAPTDTPYFCAKPPLPLDARVLRRQGIKFRDATSFDLPGWWRMSAQSPEALAALDAALKEVSA
jgi:histidinol-phosphate aminotransferase|nr:aminotransferase class I/II-fold pyridoxal phosphate-dependent enzyme [uncultured Limnohabitans sp.]